MSTLQLRTPRAKILRRRMEQQQERAADVIFSLRNNIIIVITHNDRAILECMCVAQRSSWRCILRDWARILCTGKDDRVEYTSGLKAREPSKAQV